MENVLGNGGSAICAKKILYSCKCNKIQIDGKGVNTFGVYASCQNEQLDSILDVCSDAEKVQELCKKMNDYDLSIEHFREVVYDFVVNLSL